MKKRVLSFGASTSSRSINKQLAWYASQQLQDVEIDYVELKDFELPLFSVDLEAEIGHPEAAIRFKEHIRNADGILISFAEHNGNYTAVFKNLFDWISRVEKSTWLGKPMFLMATSPGGRGGQGVLEIARKRFPFMDGIIVTEFSLPFFNKNFDPQEGILNQELLERFDEAKNIFLSSLQKTDLLQDND
ncbi:MAG: NAD(P)H-dependent oxidoreductase [Saprospiraceae bacterium]|nr:NAD(P)H-dependent oxidoreductase [Saprospiraceae bacterium]NNK89688.1 NAD(P)H-dependent oxidoreductase [Saprospiraceae bacterium]